MTLPPEAWQTIGTGLGIIGSFILGRRTYQASKRAGGRQVEAEDQQRTLEGDADPWLVVTNQLNDRITTLSAEVTQLKTDVANLQGLLNTARLYIYTLLQWIKQHMPEKMTELPPVPTGLDLFEGKINK